MASNIIRITPGQRVNIKEMLPPTAQADLGVLPYLTPWIECAYHPIASIHIYGALAGLQADVIVSNVAADGIGEVVASNVAADTVVALTKGSAFARVKIKALNAGQRIGVTYNGTAQS